MTEISAVYMSFLFLFTNIALCFEIRVVLIIQVILFWFSKWMAV